MVRWFNPVQLAATGLKTLISTIFGSFSDKREIQALADQPPYYDFSEREDLWLDYISDLGDGFNPTFTLASLLAQESITINGQELPRGKILMMGGDEVYPTPEMEEYKNRLQGPYNAAFPWRQDENKDDKPRLFAIPGNHDWYDGLTNFTRLFCQGRALGNWLTEQKRSYFALKLPHNYWLVAIDIQLESDIDEPQKQYFRQLAKNHFQSGDKVILCTAEPAWVYASLRQKRNNSEKDKAEARLHYFIDHVLRGAYENFYNKDIRISAILTGDLHHYSRYETTSYNPDDATAQLVTAGGGGAFMHLTHFLKNNIDNGHGFQGILKHCYPSKGHSRQLAWRNLLFPFYNWDMSLLLAAIYLLFVWLMQSATCGTFMVELSQMATTITHAWMYLGMIWEVLRFAPLIFILNILLVVGIYLFTDISTGRHGWNRLAGLAHAAAHFLSIYFLLWIFARLNLHYGDMAPDGFGQILVFIAEFLVSGFFVSGMIFGIYLWVSTLFFNSHPTEASSSFRHQGHKNFLRIQIGKDGLTLYPIGMNKVVTDWENQPKDSGNDTFYGSKIEYTLIEKVPIKIP